MRQRAFDVHQMNAFDAVPPPLGPSFGLALSPFACSWIAVDADGQRAAPSGWSVATVPGTGSDDVLIGSTCANALQCWGVGVTLTNLGGSQSFPNPLMEAWNGTAWTIVPIPLPDGEGGGFFDATCVNGSDCLGCRSRRSLPAVRTSDGHAD